VDKGRGTGNSRGLEKNAEFVSDSGELFSFTGTQALGGFGSSTIGIARCFRGGPLSNSWSEPAR